LTEDQKEYLKQAHNRQEYFDDLKLMAKEVLFYSKKKEWIQMKVDYCREEVDERVKEKFMTQQLHVMGCEHNEIQTLFFHSAT
jgi:hypothetical protein